MKTSGILCDKRIPIRLKRKFYKKAMRSAMLYGSQRWTINKKLGQKTSVTEIRIL